MKRILILPLILLVASCGDFDDEINKNPNLPSKASNTQLLAYAMRFLPETTGSASAPLYAQHISEAEYITLSRYETVYYNFYTWYTGPLMNIEKVLNAETFNLSEGPPANQKAVAKILKAYFFWYATDRWGDLPYTEALKGSENFTPAYDTQESIYNALFTLLDEANAEIVAGNITNDIIYGGNVTRWKKLANTIHLLMALRLSKIDAVKGAEEFNKALTGGIMTANSDNLTYVHLADPNNWNYWYNVFSVQNREWYAVSKPLVDYMLPVNDPRLPTFANRNEAGQYAGLVYGLQGNEVNTGIYQKKNVSMLGTAMRQPTTPTYLVTYAEALFAKAEAAKLGWIPGGDAEAKLNYDLAIEQSVRQWNGNSTTGLATMMSDPQIQYDPDRALEQIGYQKWVHLFMNGYEAWAEWRRTGYPVLTPPSNNNGREIPRREAYPTQEEQNNATHYADAVQRLGGTNDLYGRVWWDKP
ncbi:MAG TPA: SusD/RagB family nutrient-binding outer membrane lipoprotein [Chryseosolibacter sp.]|nr:SusD/RagB family nutrient-binding outer membrane lipoprotein [Chryseosolibacter sp.]